MIICHLLLLVQREESDIEGVNDNDDSSSDISDEFEGTDTDPASPVSTISLAKRRSLLEIYDYRERIFIIQGDKDSLHQDPGTIINLPHIKAGEAKYLVDKNNIFEIQKYCDENGGSWFKDNSVIPDGSIFLATIIDPLFIVLPLLEKSRKKTNEHEGLYNSIEDILSQETAYPALAKLQFKFELICDVITNEKTGTVYRLNNNRVIAFLKCKIEKLNSEILKQEIPVNANMSIAASVLIKLAKPSIEDITKYSISILSEYVEKHWIEQLYSAYGTSSPTRNENIISSLYFNSNYERASSFTKKDDIKKNQN